MLIAYVLLSETSTHFNSESWNLCLRIYLLFSFLVINNRSLNRNKYCLHFARSSVTGPSNNSLRVGVIKSFNSGSTAC